MTALFSSSEKINNIVFVGLILLFAVSLFFGAAAFLLLIFGSLFYAIFSKNRLKSVGLVVLFVILFVIHGFSPLLSEQTITFPEILTSLLSWSPFLTAFFITIFFAASKYEDGKKQVFCYILAAATFSSMIIIFMSGIN